MCIIHHVPNPIYFFSGLQIHIPPIFASLRYKYDSVIIFVV